MTRDAAQRFAEDWIASWNRNDLDAILAHYHDDATFRSPKAAALTGNGLVAGKDALRAYWGAAISRTTSRTFTLQRVIDDPAANELVIVYISDVNGRAVRACELFRFDPAGLVIEGEAMYGVEAR